MSAYKTFLLTSLALIAFAANSVLCRKALGEETIDAASFTAIRLLAGAITLYLIVSFKNKKLQFENAGSWQASLMLFTYAATFSFAYITLDTGTGALILFGSVQISMILISISTGHRLHVSEWIGLIVAFAGFVYLVSPGVSTPSLEGFILMTIAGIAWGIYTLKGKNSDKPLLDTTYNFIKTIPFVIVLFLFMFDDIELSTIGISLAILSGAVASGVGYSIWYAALNGLSNTQAAVVQLLVPIIAAFGGVLFVSETITSRLMVASGLVLGGILMVILGRKYLMKAAT